MRPSPELSRRVRVATDSPAERTYGVCVGGGCARPEDEDIRCPVQALRRAEELKAEFPDEPIQVLLWAGA